MNSKMLFPINEGEFKKISEQEFINLEFYQYGIYRCNIRGIVMIIILVITIITCIITISKTMMITLILNKEFSNNLQKKE